MKRPETCQQIYCDNQATVPQGWEQYGVKAFVFLCRECSEDVVADVSAEGDLTDAARNFRAACGHNPPGRGMAVTPRPRSGVVDVRMSREAWDALCRLSECAAQDEYHYRAGSVCSKCGSGVLSSGEHVRTDLPPCHAGSDT